MRGSGDDQSMAGRCGCFKNNQVFENQWPSTDGFVSEEARRLTRRVEEERLCSVAIKGNEE